MGMAHGLEARCPFLDPKLVAYAQSLNLESKLKAGHIEKHCLKEAYRKFLPAHIIDRSKQPYRAMEAQCFVRTQPEWYRDLRTANSLNSRAWLQADKAEQLLNKAEEMPHGLSPRENQMVVFILSTLLLEEQMVNQRVKGPNIAIAVMDVSVIKPI